MAAVDAGRQRSHVPRTREQQTACHTDSGVLDRFREFLLRMTTPPLRTQLGSLATYSLQPTAATVAPRGRNQHPTIAAKTKLAPPAGPEAGPHKPEVGVERTAKSRVSQGNTFFKNLNAGTVFWVPFGPYISNPKGNFFSMSGSGLG